MMDQDEEIDRANFIDRFEERRKREIEIFRRNLARRYVDDYDDEMRASNTPEPKYTLRREADSTERKGINNFINNVRGMFRAPPSPLTIEIKPRPVTVGTQTWPTTTFKPLMTTSKKTDLPAKMTADYKPKTIQPKAIDSTINPKQSNTGVKKSAIKERLSAKVHKNKCNDKTVGFSIVSKSGRYDHATTKRSVSPVFYAKPSDPFK